MKEAVHGFTSWPKLISLHIGNIMEIPALDSISLNFAAHRVPEAIIWYDPPSFSALPISTLIWKECTAMVLKLTKGWLNWFVFHSISLFECLNVPNVQPHLNITHLHSFQFYILRTTELYQGSRDHEWMKGNYISIHFEHFHTGFGGCPGNFMASLMNWRIQE